MKFCRLLITSRVFGRSFPDAQVEFLFGPEWKQVTFGKSVVGLRCRLVIFPSKEHLRILDCTGTEWDEYNELCRMTLEPRGQMLYI